MATNEELFSYYNEIISWQQQGSVLHPFLKSKIKEFRKNNGLKIQSLVERRNELGKKYFQLNEGKIVFEGEGKDRKPAMLPDMQLDDYTKEMEALMKEEVFINM